MRNGHFIDITYNTGETKNIYKLQYLIDVTFMSFKMTKYYFQLKLDNKNKITLLRCFFLFI